MDTQKRREIRHRRSGDCSGPQTAQIIQKKFCSRSMQPMRPPNASLISSMHRLHRLWSTEGNRTEPKAVPVQQLERGAKAIWRSQMVLLLVSIYLNGLQSYKKRPDSSEDIEEAGQFSGRSRWRSSNYSYQLYANVGQFLLWVIPKSVRGPGFKSQFSPFLFFLAVKMNSRSRKQA